MGQIWNNLVDGAFAGGKWGFRAGGVAGAIAGLGAPPKVITDYFLGPFGAGAVYAAIGAVGGMVVGAAVGAISGAVYGAFKGKPLWEKERPQPARERTQERGAAPELEPGRDRPTPLPETATQPNPTWTPEDNRFSFSSPAPEPPPRTDENIFRMPEPAPSPEPESTFFRDQVAQNREQSQSSEPYQGI